MLCPSRQRGTASCSPRPSRHRLRMGSGFSKEDTRMGNRHVKRWPTPLAIRETHVKTTMRCHLTQHDHQRVHKRQTLARARGGRTFLRSCWGCRLLQPLWRTVWRVLKRLKIKLPQDPALSLLRTYPKEMKRLYSRDIRSARCSQQHCFQSPPYRSNRSVHPQVNRSRRGVHTQRPRTQPQELRRSYHLQQHGWTLGHYAE